MQLLALSIGDDGAKPQRRHAVRAPCFSPPQAMQTAIVISILALSPDDTPSYINESISEAQRVSCW